MKTKLHYFTLLAIMILMSMNLHAQLLLKEQFNYPVGDSISAHGWITLSGAGVNNISCVNGSLSYPSYFSSFGNMIYLNSNGQDVNHALTSQSPGTSIYVAFLINVEGVSQTSDWFISFKGSTSTLYPGRIYIKKDISMNKYSIGLLKGSNALNTIYTSTLYDFGTTNLLILKYTIKSGVTNDSVSLFVNPAIAIESSPTLVASDISSTDLDATNIALRQGATVDSLKLYLDEIRIATTWSEAIGCNFGMITGQSTVCKGQNNVVYSTQPILNATTYVWSLPNGASGTSNTNSIAVYYGANSQSGYISVQGYDISNNLLESRILTISVQPLIVNAGSDVTKLCGDSVIFNPTTTYSGNISNLSWSWSPNTGLDTATIKSPKAKPITTTDYIVNLTSSDGCSAIDTIKIIVNAMNIDILNNTSLICGKSTILLPSNNYPGLQSNLSYQWNPAYGLDNVSIMNPVANPLLTTTYYLNVTSVEGCQATDSVKVTVNPLAITANNITKFCGDSITFGASVNSNSSTINYTWSPSIGLSNPNILNPLVNPLYTTTYTLNASDGGCTATDTITVTVNTANFNNAFTVSQTLFTTPPFSVQYTNTTPNMSAYNFVWDFGDGTVLSSNNPSVFHTYGFNGLYSVKLIATHIINSCQDTLLKPDYIYCSGGISCNYTANILQSGPITKCQGDSVFLSCNTDATYTYQWKLNGTPINWATNSQIYVHQNGAYSVTISQTSTGCVITSATVQVNFNSLATPQILTLGNVNPCTSDSLKLYTPLTYTTYNWSTGATTPFIYVMQTGIYSLTVTDANNCSASSLTDTINTSYLAPQQICLVGVDTASNKNIIIWNKPVSSVISAYKIYKETTAANVYNVIATHPYSLLSTYIDTSSNPTTKADRYKISAVDTCGSETLISSYHKTNHLTINQGVGTNWNLIWDGYEGFTFPTYNIYRGTTSASMSNIGSIQSNLTSYTDNPGAGVFYYMIEVVDPNSCSPSKSLNSSLSNIIQTPCQLPSNAGTINGLTNVCQGQNSVTYTVPSITDATSYIWTLPNGASGSSTTNSIAVNYATSTVSGNISVMGYNICGNGTASSLAVTVNPKPTTPTITQTANTLTSSAALGNQWYNAASGIITGATAQTYNPSANGYYYVIVTLLGCSSDSSNHYHYSNVGIEENENSNGIKVYPNPVSNELIIELVGSKEKVLFEIFNSIGQSISKGNLIEKTTVQTTNFAQGVYIIKLDNGKVFEFKKIVKE